MSDQDRPTVQEAGEKPQPAAEEQAKREFVKARNRRNIMIAWSLVAFMAIIFTITAVRLMQNLEARQDAAMAEEASDEELAEE